MKLKPLTGVYLMNAIYGLAGSFIGIFIPIYLLQKSLNPAPVFGFYLIFSLAVPIFFFLTYKLVHKIGLRKTVFLGYPFLFLYFFLLYTLDRYGTPLPILAVVQAISVSLYWFPLHIWLTNTSRTESMGDDVGKFFAFSQVVSLFPPLIAGFIVFYFGFKALFIITALIYLISAIPVFFLPEFPFTTTTNLTSIFRLFRQYPRYVWAEIFENIREDAEGVVWPVFVYLSFHNILSIGYIGLISGLGNVLFLWLVGKRADKMDKRKLLGTGALIMTILWALRYFAHTQISAYVFTLLAAFFGALILVPLNAVVYKVAKVENPPTFILFREFCLTIARTSLYLVAFFIVLSGNYLFIFIALACLMLFFISRKHLDLKNSSLNETTLQTPV